MAGGEESNLKRSEGYHQLQTTYNSGNIQLSKGSQLQEIKQRWGKKTKNNNQNSRIIFGAKTSTESKQEITRRTLKQTKRSQSNSRKISKTLTECYPNCFPAWGIPSSKSCDFRVRCFAPSTANCRRIAEGSSVLGFLTAIRRNKEARDRVRVYFLFWIRVLQPA